MKLAGKTDVGLVRQDNQDDYRAGQLPGDAAWALVCDGMGGARGGREASQSACDVIERCFQEHYNKCLPGEEELFLKRTLVSANRFVFQKSIREESLAGMGTTAVCALVRSGKAYLCHAGDSRAYLFRDGTPISTKVPSSRTEAIVCRALIALSFAAADALCASFLASSALSSAAVFVVLSIVNLRLLKILLFRFKYGQYG